MLPTSRKIEWSKKKDQGFHGIDYDVLKMSVRRVETF